MKGLILLTIALMLASSAAIANLDDFDGDTLDDMWSVRDPLAKAAYALSGGKMTLDLTAGADMYIQGVDGGVMFLMAPPDADSFSVELLANAAVGGPQPPACHIGIVFFNEDSWAYSAWGPYANTDIRLEDCVGAEYRWRPDTLVGLDLGDVAIDENVYLRVVKTGDTLEFFAKGSAGEDWVSAGTDEKLGPNYTPGDYQIGIIAKSWGGSVDSAFEFDYFNVPEFVVSVDVAGKLTTTWGAIKGN